MGIRKIGLIFVLVVAASRAPAQKVVSAKSGLIYFSLGRVWIDDAQLNPGEIFRQLKTTETLRTSRGRAGVLLNPGAVLWLGNNSQLRMDDVALIDSSISLLAGSAVITITNPPKPDRVELHIGGGAVLLERDGMYRFDSSPNQARLRVFSGRAEVRRGDSPPLSVHQGLALEMDNLQVAKFDTKDTDALDRWAKARPTQSAPGGLRPIPPRVVSRSGAPAQPQTQPAVDPGQRSVAGQSAANPIPFNPFPPNPNGPDQ